MTGEKKMSEEEELIKEWMTKHSKLDMAKQLINSQIALKKENDRRIRLEIRSIDNLREINELQRDCKREKSRADEHEQKSLSKIKQLQSKCKRGGELMTSAVKKIKNLNEELQGVGADNIALLEELNQARNDKEALEKQLEIESAYRSGRQLGKSVLMGAWEKKLLEETGKSPYHFPFGGSEEDKPDDIPF